MNVKDHEEKQDMKISEEKEDDIACNIYHAFHCGKHAKKDTWLIFDKFEIILHVPNVYTGRHRFRP